MSGVTAVNGGELMGINKNLGDKVRYTLSLFAIFPPLYQPCSDTLALQATYSNNCGAKTVCQDYTGCTGGGCEAKKAGKC